MKLKYSREMKVGILAVIAVFLMYFGFNFLKGVNIFSATNSYYAAYTHLNGLTEQAPVYIKGYKVGQVDKIYYDFTDENAFSVAFSIDKAIALPCGTQTALIADGLLGGSALQLNLPDESNGTFYAKGDTLPAVIVPGLLDNLQDEMLAQLSSVLTKVDSLMATVNQQLEGDHICRTLAQIDNATRDLAVVSGQLKTAMNTQVPAILDDAQGAVADIRGFSANLGKVDIDNTIHRVDSMVSNLQTLTASINSADGTVGLLLNDKELYLSLANTVASADSLLVDLKANPKRYVHFSLFGNKDKKK